MKAFRQAIALSVFFAVAVVGGEDAKKAFTDSEAARTADPDFSLQGDYTNDGGGMQVVALGGGKFYTATLKGGLPGAGWDGKPVTSALADSEGIKKLVAAGWKRIERSSPTLGQKPPAGAVALFDGESVDAWKGGKKSADGLLCEGTQTVKAFKNFTLHLEFRMPYKPNVQPSSQDRGNSGVYIFNRYEVQLLDSFGLHFFANTHDEKSWAATFQNELGFKPGSNRNQFCASMYHSKTPDLNASYPPLEWQTYDIIFRAPVLDGTTKKENARITVVHNGIKVQDNVELKRGTGAGGNKPEVAEESIYLQGHGNPVRFRNIWIVEE